MLEEIDRASVTDVILSLQMIEGAGRAATAGAIVIMTPHPARIVRENFSSRSSIRTARLCQNI